MRDFVTDPSDEKFFLVVRKDNRVIDERVARFWDMNPSVLCCYIWKDTLSPGIFDEEL